MSAMENMRTSLHLLTKTEEQENTKMKNTLIILFLASLSLFGQEKVFFDNFSGKLLKKEWKASDGRWRIGPNQKLQQIIGAPNRLGLIRLNIPEMSAVEIQAKLSYIGGQNKKDFGAGFQICVPEKNGSFYELKFGPVGGKGLSVYRVTVEEKDGKLRKRYKVLTTCETPIFEREKEYSIQIRYKDGAVCVSMDGEEILDFKDDLQPLPGKGTIALFTYGAAAAFDNIVVLKE